MFSKREEKQKLHFVQIFPVEIISTGNGILNNISMFIINIINLVKLPDFAKNGAISISGPKLPKFVIVG